MGNTAARRPAQPADAAEPPPPPPPTRSPGLRRASEPPAPLGELRLPAPAPLPPALAPSRSCGPTRERGFTLSAGPNTPPPAGAVGRLSDVTERPRSETRTTTPAGAGTAAASALLPIEAIQQWRRQRLGSSPRPSLVRCEACGTPVAGSGSAAAAHSSSHHRTPHPGCSLCPVVERFNSRPKEAFRDLTRSVRVDGAAVVAEFLRSTPFLTKATVGEFLAEAENERVLREFAMGFPLAGLAFDAALRLFMSFFGLTGEAQKIDRIVEAFAAAFVAHNPDGPLPSADVAYTLSFATIMLHTDQHSSQIRPADRMTKASFLRNHARLDERPGAQPLPAAMLEELFDSIVRTPLQPAHNLEPHCLDGEVDLLFAGEGPLGLQLETSFSDTVVVKAIAPGSAQADLRVGLVLVGINGDSVLGLGFDQTMLRLRTSPRPFWLRFAEPEAHFGRWRTARSV